MQIVIDIPDRIHYGIEKGITVNGSSASQIVLDAVKNGTPLPKGHGRLIDYGYVVDAIDDFINAEEYRYTNATDYLRKRIKNAPTIIEAESKVNKND